MGRKKLHYNQKSFLRYVLLIFGIFSLILLGILIKNKSNDQQIENLSKTHLENTTYYISDVPITYTIFMPVNNDDFDFVSNPVWTQLQEMTNIYFEFISPLIGKESEEKFNQLILAGDYPDAVLNTTTGYPGGFSKAINDNVYIDLKPYVKDYAPNYYKILHKHKVLNTHVYTSNGELPGFWKIFDPEKSLPIISGLTIRKDFLAQTGKDIPVTIDDWTNLLRALKEINTIESPLIFGQENGVNVTAEFLSAFGIGAAPISIMNPSSQLFYPKDGKMHYGAIEEGYKEYLLLMNHWYKEGLLDKDFGIRSFTDINERREMIAQGKAAVNWQYAEWFTQFKGCGNESNLLQAVPMPKLNVTDKNVMWMVSRKPYMGELLAITTACDNVIPLIQFFDFLYSEEGIRLTNYGIEGDTYIIENDTIKFTDKILRYEKGAHDALGKYINNNNGALYDLSYTPDIQYQLYGEEVMEMKNIWLESSDLFVQDYELTANENAQLVEIMVSISKYVEEYTIRAIIDRRVALNWEEHVETIKAMNLDKALEIMQNVYERQRGEVDETAFKK